MDEGIKAFIRTQRLEIHFIENGNVDVLISLSSLKTILPVTDSEDTIR